jgi:flagellar hook protein FlgE
MMRSLQSGVNGVRNHQLKMDVVGNNIANVNTIGFKSGRITFADTIASLLSGGTAPRDTRGGVNPIQVGLGMKVHAVDNNFSQGALESTGYTTDLAIQGKGFFVVKEGEQNLFTRAGNFTIDAAGRLVAGGGVGLVQGYQADAQGNILDTGLTDINIPLQMKSAPKATTSAQLYSNLDSDATLADASLTSLSQEGGVTSVTGTASNGVGGDYLVHIEGTQNATQSTRAGASPIAAPILESDYLVGGLLIDPTTLDNLQITVDASVDTNNTPLDPTDDTVTDYSVGTTYNIAGLDSNSTVGDLINAIHSQVPGVEVEIIGGELQVTRTKAGDGGSTNVIIRDTVSGGGVQSLGTEIFGTNTFISALGEASDLRAITEFTDSQGNTATYSLSIEADETTGYDTTITGLGGGGVTIIANDQLVATGIPGASDPLTAVTVETADTSHSTSIQVYDEQGTPHTISMEFTKTLNANQWMWEASVTEPDLAVSGAAGTVEFNSDGTLKQFRFDDQTLNSFSFLSYTSQTEVSISLDAGTAGAMDGITQTSSPFSTRFVGQDGYAMGTLESIDIDNTGEVIGNFSNGQDLTLAALVLADFTNTNGLTRAGNNMWASSESSGDAIYGLAETNFASKINRGYLEMSNVDLVKEFTEMITAQRGFQANARVITVSDQILTEVTNLKR